MAHHSHRFRNRNVTRRFRNRERSRRYETSALESHIGLISNLMTDLLASKADSRKNRTPGRVCNSFYQRAVPMSRLFYSFMIVFSLAVVSFSTVGCGGASNEVIVDDRPEAEIAAEEEEYEKQMQAAEDVTQ